MVPSQMSGLYGRSTLGFCGGAIAMTGVRVLQAACEAPVPSGEHAGIPVDTIRFSLEWSAA